MLLHTISYRICRYGLTSLFVRGSLQLHTMFVARDLARYSHTVRPLTMFSFLSSVFSLQAIITDGMSTWMIFGMLRKTVVICCGNCRPTVTFETLVCGVAGCQVTVAVVVGRIVRLYDTFVAYDACTCSAVCVTENGCVVNK